MEKQIIYTKWGIGNSYNDRIEINENLKKYPELHDYVIQHELGHNNKLFTLKELKHDLTPSKYSFEIIKFMLKHPKALSQLLPIIRSNKRIALDINLMIIYFTITIILLGFIFYTWGVI